eukprot:UN19575
MEYLCGLVCLGFMLVLLVRWTPSFLSRIVKNIVGTILNFEICKGVAIGDFLVITFGLIWSKSAYDVYENITCLVPNNNLLLEG